MATVSATAPVGNLNNDKAAQKPSSMQSSGAPPVPSSAQGVLALLQEDNTELQAAALMQLKDLVEVHWMELADVLPDIEALVEDQAFPQRDLAAHVASRIYFHLEAFSDALKFALESGPWLDLNSDSLYAETILAECIDEYIRHRTAEYEAETLSSIPGGPAAALATSSEDVEGGAPKAGTSDEAFRAAVERVVLAQLRGASGSPGAPNALGIALDARRIEEVELLLTNAPDKIALLNYLSMNLQSLVSSKRFRQEVTALVTRLYKEALHGIGPEQQPEVYGHLCRCLLLQEDIEGVATILNEFMRKPKTPALPRPQLVAYQIAFDLMDLENPNLMQALLRHPLLSLPKPPEAAAVETAETPTPSTGVVGKVAEPAQEAAAEIGTQQQQQQQRDATTAAAAATAAVPAVPVDNLMTVTALAAAAAEPEPTGADSTDPYTRKLAVLRSIVSGSASVDFTLQFLNRKSNTDLQLLDSYKNSLDARLSLLHHGLLLAHALQQSGTGCDVFLRRNLEWMGRAANWSKYSATASIGAIHRGNVMNSVKVLQTYLPGAGGGGASASHSEGGALYALGLIHSCLPNPKIRSFILGQLRHGDNTEKEAVLHGGCLGLGLTCLGDAADSEAYDALRTLLFLDSAITGEGAALGLGLLLMGSGSPSAAAELLGYARDTQHEKIGRACAVALALICFQREEEADSLIRQCLEDSDALIRYGGVFCIGMAYCATGKKTAVERLLHRAVADVNDDVRRAAVLSLGFVLCGHSEELLRVMKLLGGSFNPHVRYGAAFALGFASAGSGNAEAVQLLQALTTDPTDFVRQGAFIGLGLLMQLQNEASCPGVTAFRETLQKVMKDKHEDSLARFGAVLAAGLLDAGGRNVSVRFFSARKVLRMHAVAGVCLFAQLWYSFPLIYCLCLSFSPSALIGLVAHDELEEAAVLEEVPAAEEKTQKKDINESAVEVDGGVPTAMAAPEETSQQQQEPQQQDRQSAEKPEKKLPNIATLRIPCGWKIACKAPDQSLFAYPPPLSAGESKTDAVKAVKAILSTTAKRNAAIRKQQEKQEAKKTRVQGTQMDTDVLQKTTSKEGGTEGDSAAEAKTSEVKRERSAGDSPAESVKEGGDNTVELINPCRVLARQEAFLKAVPSSRYRRVLGESLTGFIILDDKEPTQAETYIEAREKAVQEKEPEPFEPFHWTG